MSSSIDVKSSPKLNLDQPLVKPKPQSWFTTLTKSLHILWIRFLGFITVTIWGSFPPKIQLGASKLVAQVYNLRLSRHFIKPYCKLHYKDPNYQNNFLPYSRAPQYQSFQDFFARTFKDPIVINTKTIWPCEGLLCEAGTISELKQAHVKGEKRHPRDIFGAAAAQIPDNYQFSNVFLHNNNYHRIHSPVDGKITRIERIPGDLVLLRPWVHFDTPSIPAMRNERLNIDLQDNEGRTWYLSIVGGPLVATIERTKELFIGSQFKVGQELATFLLGSTCCLASPTTINVPVGHSVSVGDAFS